MSGDRDVTRERIISAAEEVFSEYGFFRAPVHLIAREAGVSKGLVFWYFRDKMELIVEVAKRSLPLDVIDSCLEKNLRGRDVLECIGRNYLNKYRDPRWKSLLLHAIALETQVREIAEDVRKLCEEKIEAVAERAFGESSTKTRILLRIFFGGLMCFVLRPPKDIDEQTFLKNLINIIFKNGL